MASLPYSINFFHNIFQHARTLYPQHALFPDNVPLSK